MVDLAVIGAGAAGTYSDALVETSRHDTFERL
jgi:hypothetical protein